jgi:hypothetical protein
MRDLIREFEPLLRTSAQFPLLNQPHHPSHTNMPLQSIERTHAGITDSALRPGTGRDGTEPGNTPGRARELATPLLAT